MKSQCKISRYWVAHLALLFLGLFFAFGTAPSARAQTVTGQIGGTIVDQSHAIITGAKVTLIFDLTGQTRNSVSNNSGDFVFTEVPPGSYTLVISAPGFENYRQNNITVSTSERVALHEIQMTLGTVTQTVSVESSSAHVETDSSEHSSEITAAQITAVPDRGRNFIDYLSLVPGSTVTTQTDAPGSATQTFGFNGAENQSLIQLDGIQSQDIGNAPGTGFLAPNVDAISEVKVLTGAVPAEYGARANGSVVVSVRSGSKQFHGTLYQFNRNDAYNANTYFNNLNHIGRQPYKYNNPGGTLGGPVLIPGTQFNKNRDRLFFFFAFDLLFRNVPASTTPTQLVVPTLAERGGNFSLTNPSAISNGALRCPDGSKPTSTNPLTCAAYPQSTAGTNLIALFPNPTCNRPGTNDATANPGLTLPTCPSTSNFINGAFVYAEPRQDYILRTDYQVTKNNLLYVRLIQDYTGQNGGTFLGGSAWGQLLTNYGIFSRGGVVTLVSNIRSNIVNEFVAGENITWQNVGATSATQFAKNVRTNVGLGSGVLPTLYPIANNNPQDLLPNASFGGGSFVGGAASLSEDGRFPFYSVTRSYNATDSLAWTVGQHNMKFGIYYENSPRTEVPMGSTWNGSMSFGVSSFSAGAFANPFDTGYTYANAYLGVIQTYSESSARPLVQIAVKTIQGYAQDNWKAMRTLSLDYGIRFYHNADPNERNGVPFAYFNPAVYTPTAQPTLIAPGASGYPASAIGLFTPGSGTPYQGMVVSTSGRLRNDPGIGIAPRLGFSWDVLGDGKTALRGGVGVFFDQITDPASPSSYVIMPPAVVTSNLFNSTLSSLGGASGLLGPVSVYGTPTNYHAPVSYQYQLGVQRDLTHSVLLDASYVANTSRHGFRNQGGGTQINGLPYGTDFVPANVSNAGRPNFLRPYQGYAGINIDNFDLNSNYNSLQVQVTRHFGRLQAGGSYTYSKLLDDSSTRVANVGFPFARYYGPGGNDRRHNLTINYQYAISPVRPNSSWLIKETLAGWNIQGLTNFVSGGPSGLGSSFSYDVSGTNGNGGPILLNRLKYPVLPKPQRVVPSAGHAPQYLDITAVGVPAGGPGVCVLGGAISNCGVGNAPVKGAFYGPGINNWDISLFKIFPLSQSERQSFQLRIESYNTFNHTQFSGVNSSVSILSGGVVAPVSAQNSTYGQFNGTQSARILVLGGKLSF
jgi:hypothetical protein